MRYYDPETKVLASLYDLLVAVVDGFPKKNLNAYTKKQKQSLINTLISFSEENAGILSSELYEIIYPYPELSYDKLCDILKNANKKHIATMRHGVMNGLRLQNALTSIQKMRLSRLLMIILCAMKCFSKRANRESKLSPRVLALIGRRSILKILFSEIISNRKSMNIPMRKLKLPSGYRLSFIQAEEIVTVNFSNIYLETQLINYSVSNRWDGSPWCQISELLTAIG